MTAVPPRALLLAGGYGTRLRPLTDTLPKCLVPIHGKPLLSYWLDLLFESGVERALINTHYLPDQVRSFRDQSPWRERIDLAHEDTILGTAGTVRENRGLFWRSSACVCRPCRQSIDLQCQLILPGSCRSPRRMRWHGDDIFNRVPPSPAEFLNWRRTGPSIRFMKKLKIPQETLQMGRFFY